jgi:hypothetical protein
MLNRARRKTTTHWGHCASRPGRSSWRTGERCPGWQRGAADRLRAMARGSRSRAAPPRTRTLRVVGEKQAGSGFASRSATKVSETIGVHAALTKGRRSRSWDEPSGTRPDPRRGPLGTVCNPPRRRRHLANGDSTASLESEAGVVPTPNRRSVQPPCPGARPP